MGNYLNQFKQLHSFLFLAFIHTSIVSCGCRSEVSPDNDTTSRNNSTISTSTRNTSGPSTSTPNSATGTPDSGPDTPDSGPDTPDSGPDTPDSGPDTPDSGPDTPDSGPDTPGSTTGTFASDPDTSVPNTDTFSSAPHTPGSSLDIPDSDPDTFVSGLNTSVSSTDTSGSDPDTSSSTTGTFGSDPDTSGADAGTSSTGGDNTITNGILEATQPFPGLKKLLKDIRDGNPVDLDQKIDPQFQNRASKQPVGLIIDLLTVWGNINPDPDKATAYKADRLKVLHKLIAQGADLKLPKFINNTHNILSQLINVRRPDLIDELMQYKDKLPTEKIGSKTVLEYAKAIKGYDDQQIAASAEIVKLLEDAGIN